MSPQDMDILSHVSSHSNNNIQSGTLSASLCSSLVQCHNNIPLDKPCTQLALLDLDMFLVHIVMELKLLPDNGTKQDMALSDGKFLLHNNIPQNSLPSVLSIPLHHNIVLLDMSHNRSHFDFHSDL